MSKNKFSDGFASGPIIVLYCTDISLFNIEFLKFESG